MTDQPEAKTRIKETEDAEVDFEGHRVKDDGPSDAKAATDDDSADFEGHRLAGPEKAYKKA